DDGGVRNRQGGQPRAAPRRARESRSGAGEVNASAPQGLTVRGAVLDGVEVSLRAVDGTVVALGPAVTAEPGDEVSDGSGLALVDGMDPARSTELRAEAIESLDERAVCGPRIGASFTPHGIYTVSEESLSWVAEESAVRQLPVHIHFLEVESEVTGCIERAGTRPGPYLDRLGLLTERTVLAHGCWMEEAEFELAAARGATVVTNPVSNLKLAVGRIFPYAVARHHRVAVGLGTDGASSNNGLDMLQDVKVFALLQKYA